MKNRDKDAMKIGKTKFYDNYFFDQPAEKENVATYGYNVKQNGTFRGKLSAE